MRFLSREPPRFGLRAAESGRPQGYGVAMIPKLTDGSSDSAVYLFAHGAGAPMDSPFMARVAGGLAAQGIQVVRFEFPYMAARREGARRPPDREPILRFTWAKLIDQHRDDRKLFIGGKSMGGRIATMVADETGVDGAVCFGYPFHPPGRPETLHPSSAIPPDAAAHHPGNARRPRLTDRGLLAGAFGDGRHPLDRGRGSLAQASRAKRAHRVPEYRRSDRGGGRLHERMSTPKSVTSRPQVRLL